MNLAQLLRDLYDYNSLKIRSDGLGEVLPVHDLRRLDHLGRALELPVAPGVADLQRRQYRRFEVRMRGVLEDAGFLTEVDIISIGAGGITLVPAGHLELGDIAHIRINDPTIGRTYRLTVQAVWRPHKAFSSTLGCAFVHLPTEPPLRPLPPVRMMTMRPR